MSQTCISVLSFRGRPERIKELKDFVKAKSANEKNVIEVFSLDSILPMPDRIRSVVGGNLVGHMEQTGPLPKKIIFSPEILQMISNEEFHDVLAAFKNLREFGRASWYDWSLANWGTKWEAFDTSYDSDEVVRLHTSVGAPYPVFEALSRKFRDVQIEVKVAVNARELPQYMRYRDGEVMTLEVFSPNSEATIRFSCDILKKDFYEEIRAMRDEIARFGPPRVWPKEAAMQ